VTRVLLFASARELAGMRETELIGATVSDLLAAAAATFGPEFGRLCSTCSIVVDDEIVHRSDYPSRSPGTVLAILPPVSGGSEDRFTLRVAFLAVSDDVVNGRAPDSVTSAIESSLSDHVGVAVAARSMVGDDFDAIAAALTTWCDDGHIDLIITHGGTGLRPRDVTPEATRAILDVEAPGISELMRTTGIAHTRLAALARQTAGRRGNTLVINLPGSLNGALESLDAVVDLLGPACAAARVGRP
jgi:molybdenum cofactor synthesis domain-containing protein